MDTPKHDLSGWLGLIIFCAAILIFLALVKCQPDFFQNITTVF